MWVGGSMEVKAWVKSNRKCLCGCGRDPGKHKRVAVECEESYSIMQWNKLIENAPECRCGCGRKVEPSMQFDYWKTVGRPKTYKQYFRGHANFKGNVEYVLTKHERMAILGTLLGDTSICYPHKGSKYPRLSSTHGLVQKDWAEYKASFLGNIGVSTRITKNAGYGDYSVASASKTVSCLDEIFRITRGGDSGKKFVTREWLDQIGDVGLAWWIADDGCYSKSNMRICTDGFTEGEQHTIAQWFCDNYGSTWPLSNGRGSYFINFASWTALEVCNEIRSHLPESMQYKLGRDRFRAANRRVGKRLRHNCGRYPLFFCQQPSCS
jgi:hypothetical protein